VKGVVKNLLDEELVEGAVSLSVSKIVLAV
jgi:hypothetical protein